LAKPPAPDQRTAVLNARRELKMARSTHAYVRGSTDDFYQWIGEHADRALPAGPPIWICGDCHVGNLGPIGHREGHTVVELRDLDQTVIGNPAHDIVRLALSLAMACRGSGLPGVTTARITEELVAGYEQALATELADEIVDELPEPIRFVMKRAVRRTSKQLLAERFGERGRKIPLGRSFWPLDAAEHAAVASLLTTQPVRRLVTLLSDRADDASVELVDAAFWAKGCSSLGLWRAAVLVDIVEPTKKRRSKRTPALIDIKQAVDARCPWASGVAPVVPNGERVVRGARELAPALGTRMLATEVLDRSVYVRELLPQDLKLELDEISVDSGRAVARHLGKVVGSAHRRQLDEAARASWLAELTHHRTKQLDAPSWLWSALLELVSVHEHAYLEHCRRYALAIDRVRDAAPDAVADEPPPELVAARDSPSMRSAQDDADADAGAG
jgi:uncharacterized protein (DUF2252 family)